MSQVVNIKDMDQISVESPDCQLIRDSFERFGDDFCELILSFVTLKDKFVFECVCKQWQRVVFNRQTRLEMIDCDGYDSLKSLGKTKDENKFYTIFTINCHNFGSLLKKCPNVAFIDINWKCMCDDECLTLIGDHCPRLERLFMASTDHSPFSEQVLHQFGKSCQKSLQYFRTDDKFNGNLKTFLNYCSNLRSIDSIRDSQILSDSDEEFLPKLKKLSFMATNRTDLKSFETLKNKYRKQLTELSLMVKLDENPVFSYDANVTLGQISCFSCLTHLRINLKSFLRQSLSNGIEAIGHNCRRLKCIAIDANDSLLFDNVFKAFKEFKSLKQLSINCNYMHFYDSSLMAEDNGSVNYGSIEWLKNSRELTHLKINLKFLSDNNLKNIDTILPKLNTLEVKCCQQLTDISLEAMEKLSNLRQLVIFCGKNVNNFAINRLIKAIPKLSNICFDGFPKISEESIQLLAINAINNPKVKYNFYYSGTPVPSECIPVPNNVKISNFWDKQWY